MTAPLDLGTVLVVDDQAPNRELVAAYLAQVPCRVEQAADGPSALTAVAAAPPDLVLIDVMMPGLDGYSVTRQLKANPRTAMIPVILVTALTGRADRLRGLEAGADEFLTKPVDRGELVARVRTLLRLKRLHDERAALRNEFLRQIIDANPHCLWVRDAQGRLTLVNRAMASFLGTTVEELQGRSGANFHVDPQVVEAFLQTDRAALERAAPLVIPEMPWTRAATGADAAASRVQSPAAARGGDRGSERRRGRHAEAAAAVDRRGRRPGDGARPDAGARARGPDAARPGDREPGDQRPRRHARGGQAHDRDRERRAG
jgi:DNA-binding response OmpR family regulator